MEKSCFDSKKKQEVFIFCKSALRTTQPPTRAYLGYSYGNTAVGALRSPPSSVGGLKHEELYLHSSVSFHDLVLN